MISYIIVSYNTVDLTVQAIDSIIAKCKNCEIIVVDNNSHDGTVEVIKKKYQDSKLVTLINSDKNVGFSIANNLGARRAKGDFYVFINPDTVCIEDIGSKLYTVYKEHFSGKDVILSPQILNPDYTNQHCMNLYPVITLRTVYDKLVKLLNRNTIRKSDWITGVSLSMTRSTFNKLGGWNEEYDLYSEDLDLCYRLKKLKGAAYVVGNIKLIHYGNQSGKQVYNSEYKSAQKKINSLRKFYELYYNDKKFTRYIKFMSLFEKTGYKRRYINENGL